LKNDSKTNCFQYVHTESDPSIKTALSDVLQVYLHYELQECRADHFEDGYLSSAQCDFSRNELYAALADMRHNAVNLADSFDFADRQLNSAIGRRDGDAYEALYRWAQNSELNKQQVLPFHHETLGKMMKEVRNKRDSKI
jgi:acyl-CoA oxidase